MLHTIVDSIIFLSIARDTICEMVEMSGQEKTDELKYYIQNEASDYEIMSLLIFGEMDENKFDPEKEQLVWQEFRKEMVRNFSTLSEHIEEKSINDLIFELGPVSHLGYSSAKPILENCRKNGMFTQQYVNEIGWDPLGKPGSKKPDKSKDKKELKDKAKEIGTTLKATAKDVGKAGKYVGTALGSSIADEQLRKQHAAQKQKDVELKKKMASNKAARDKYLADKAAKEKKDKQIELGKKVVKGAGAAAVAAAVGYGAYKLYQKYKANKPKAIKAQIAALRSGMGSCSKASDPEKCKVSINTKIEKLNAKLQKMSA